MFHLGTPWWELIVRSVAIYAVLLGGLRLFGKREIGQFTIYDLVFILLVANAVQPAMTGPDSSLLGGVIIIAALIVSNFLVATLDRLPGFHRIFTPSPAVVIRDGAYLEPALAREGVDHEELGMAIREHGLEDVSDVKLGVLEADGTVSIVPKDSEVRPGRRRVRRRYKPSR